MALDGTYTGLQASIADWLARTDLTAQIPDFIALCEESLNERLRLRSMQVNGYAFTAGAPLTPLPTDYLEMQAVRHASAPFEDLTLVAESWANEHDYYQMYYNARPRYYLIEGDSFRVASLNGGTWNLTMDYYAKLDLATDGTNPVFVKYPSTYLFGSLLASVPFIGDDSRGTMWQSGYENAIGRAITDNASATWSGSVPAMRVRRAP